MFIKVQSFCNPLPEPVYLKISEFAFNSDNTWTLELVDDFLRDSHSIVSRCDSLFICSSTGRTKVIGFQENDECYPYQVVITQDDILSPLLINREGDSITIVHFFNGREDIMPKTVLTFGNYPNAMIDKPAEGQSIAAISRDWSGYWDGGEYTYAYYSKNNKPSLGDCYKNESYMYGKLQGKVYDMYNQPLCNQIFKFIFNNKTGGTYIFQTDYEGNYNLNVYSNTLILDKIYIQTSGGYNPSYSTAEIDFVQMDIEVGDIIDLDIHLIGPPVSSPEMKIANNPIKLYPNPVKEGSVLNYEIDLPVFTSNIELEVLSLNGKQLLKEKITNKTGIIDLQKMAQGIYILNCKMNGKSLYSTRIIIAK